RCTCGSSSMPALSGVRNGPGASALTVIPVPASSTARLRVSWTTAPLLAAYPLRAAAPTRPSALARVTMRPYPAARMGATAARQGSPSPHRVRAREAPSNRHVRLLKGAAALDAGAGHEHIRAAVLGEDPVPQAGDCILVGDVAAVARRGAPGLGG